MSNVEGRLSKLEQAEEEPARTVFFWRDGNYLTPEQKVGVAEAEARGDKVTIFSWRGGNTKPPDLNEMVKNATDEELQEMIFAGTRNIPKQPAEGER